MLPTEIVSPPRYVNTQPRSSLTNIPQQRYNLEDPLFDSLALEAYTDGFIVTGYDKSVPEKPQLFAAEDIVILTDGVCSSTCSMFVEMMHNEAGVKTVVVGGRPSYGPMQAVG